MPPFWSLGFHLCRYGYNTIDNMLTMIEVNFSKKKNYFIRSI
jgi:hypothetical protein